MDRNPARTSAAAPRTVDVAEQAKAEGFEALSDQELRDRLCDCARSAVDQDDPGQAAKAIGLVDLAIRRRMGLWRAVLSDTQHLSGGVRVIRDTSEDIIRPRAVDLSPVRESLSLEDWARTQSVSSGLSDNLKLPL